MLQFRYHQNHKYMLLMRLQIYHCMLICVEITDISLYAYLRRNHIFHELLFLFVSWMGGELFETTDAALL